MKIVAEMAIFRLLSHLKLRNEIKNKLRKKAKGKNYSKAKLKNVSVRHKAIRFK